MTNEGKANGHDPKDITVIINGTPVDVPKKEEISFEDVVRYAFPDETSPDDRYSVTYERSNNPNKPDGVLTAGGSVKIKKDMIFVVSSTGQS